MFRRFPEDQASKGGSYCGCSCQWKDVEFLGFQAKPDTTDSSKMLTLLETKVTTGISVGKT